MPGDEDGNSDCCRSFSTDSSLIHRHLLGQKPYVFTPVCLNFTAICGMDTLVRFSMLMFFWSILPQVYANSIK